MAARRKKHSNANVTKVAGVAATPSKLTSSPAAAQRSSGIADVAFRTKRLAVFRFSLGPIDECYTAPRQLFVAFRSDQDRGPLVAATALISTAYGLARYAVDWIEVSTEFRRAGIATELLDGLEVFLNDQLDLMGTYAELEAALNEARVRRGKEPSLPAELDLLLRPSFPKPL